MILGIFLHVQVFERSLFKPSVVLSIEIYRETVLPGPANLLKQTMVLSKQSLTQDLFSVFRNHPVFHIVVCEFLTYIYIFFFVSEPVYEIMQTWSVFFSVSETSQWNHANMTCIFFCFRNQSMKSCKHDLYFFLFQKPVYEIMQPDHDIFFICFRNQSISVTALSIVTSLQSSIKYQIGGRQKIQMAKKRSMNVFDSENNKSVNFLALDKSSSQINIFPISPWKHTLWVLIRSASVRHF